MKNYIVWIVIAMLAFALIVEGVYAKKRRKKRNELESKAATLMMQGKFKELYSFLNSDEALKGLTKFYRAYLKMNGSIMDGNDSLIEQSLNEIKEVKMNKQQKVEVYLNAFNYYVDKEEKEKVDHYKELLLKNVNDSQTLTYIERLYDTKILKNDKHLNEILDELNSQNKVNKITDYLLLVEIYKNLGDKDNADKYNNLYLNEVKKTIN